MSGVHHRVRSQSALSVGVAGAERNERTDGSASMDWFWEMRTVAVRVTHSSVWLFHRLSQCIYSVGIVIIIHT